MSTARPSWWLLHGWPCISPGIDTQVPSAAHSGALRLVVRACMRQVHDPKEDRVGLRSSGAIEQPTTKGTTKLAKILSAPARCQSLSRRRTTMKLSPPRPKVARGMRCAPPSVRSAGFGTIRSSVLQGQATRGAQSAERAPLIGTPKTPLAFLCPAPWPRVSWTKSWHRQARRSGKQRRSCQGSRREPRCQSTRFNPSRPDFS